MKNFVIAAVVLAGLAVVGIGTCAVLTMNSPAQSAEELRKSPYYRTAAQEISLDQDVLDALGQPLEFGTAAVKRRTGDDESGSVELDLQVKGPKGAGHGQLTVAKRGQNAAWVSEGGNFFMDSGGRPIRLLPKQ